MHAYSFEQAMELAYQVEPKGTVRVYFSHDLQLWFVNTFRTWTEAASATGCSGKTADEALQSFCESCVGVLGKRAASDTTGAADANAPRKVSFAAIGCGDAWVANKAARRELTAALAGWE